MVSIFSPKFRPSLARIFSQAKRKMSSMGKGTRNNREMGFSPGHSNTGQDLRDLLGGKHKDGGDKENGRDTAKWRGVSFQSVRLWNEKVLDRPVQHLGSLDLGLKERNNRSHPVSEDLPDFFHVFVLHLNPVQDEIDGVFSNLVFLD